MTTRNEPTPDGVVERSGEGIVLRFERAYPHPIERVWAALTEPPQLAQWLSSDGVVFEPHVGGRVLLPTGGGVDITSVVGVCDPPHQLAYEWDSVEWEGGRVTWTLHPANDGTDLVFTHVHPDKGDDQLAKSLAGWHTLHDMLGAHLAGHSQPWDMDAWRDRYRHYQRHLGVDSAS